MIAGWKKEQIQTFKRVPLLALIFGKRQITIDSGWAIHSIQYKDCIYITKQKKSTNN